MLSALRQSNYVYKIIRNIFATFAESKLFIWNSSLEIKGDITYSLYYMNNVPTLDFQFVFRFRCRLEST